MSDKQAAYQRDNQVLRGELRRQDAHHRKTLDAKNARIEELRAQTPTGLRSLYGTYQNLEPLLILLDWVRLLADPSQSSPMDKPKVSSSHRAIPEGHGTQKDRDRLVKVNKWISRLLFTIQRELGTESEEQPGHVETITGDRRLRCNREGCEGRGRFQAWDNDACQWCGGAFTAGHRLAI